MSIIVWAAVRPRYYLYNKHTLCNNLLYSVIIIVYKDTMWGKKKEKKIPCGRVNALTKILYRMNRFSELTNY